MVNKITITGDFNGSYTVCAVLERDVPAALLAQMRRSGQNDCGKRQSLVPLYCEQYPEFIFDISRKAMNADFVLPAEGPMLFGGDPNSRKDAEEVAARLAEFETKNGRPMELVPLNREIPCY